MYYLRLADGSEETVETERLVYYCRHCGFEDNSVNITTGAIVKADINKDTDHYEMAINKFTKLDPTLPRTKTIKCPKPDCEDGEVLYIRYDRKNIKFLYHCTKCSASWTTSQ